MHDDHPKRELRGGGDPDERLPELNPRTLSEMIVNRPPHPPEGSGIDPDRSSTYYDQ